MRKIWVKYYMNSREHRYYILDWNYQDPSTEFCKYEEVELTEGVIEEMAMINEDNIEYLGYFESKEEVKEALEEMKDEDAPDYDIEYNGAGFYLVWAGERVTPALEVLDIEYDIAHENGNFVSWLIGWSRYDVTSPEDLVAVLEELYGEESHDYVRDYVRRAIESKGLSWNQDIYLDSIIDKTLDYAPRVGRIDPAYLP